jgi:hypothetical protein
MAIQARPAGHLVVALALLATPPPTRANVSGYAEVQGQATQTGSRSVGGDAQSTAMTLLMETLSLHYAGLPFGPAVAVATAGGTFTSVNTWYGNGLQASGQVLSFDASLGFLPRRAVPLRLYAGGTTVTGTGGPLATTGAGPSLVYGGSLNLEPGAWAPGLRLDLSESRSSRPGFDRLSDVQRRLLANGFLDVKGQRVNLALRLESDHREAAGDVSARTLTLDWGSPRQQTTLLASEVRRSLAILTGITTDRLLSASSVQRWHPAWSTQVDGRVTEASGAGASGTQGDARAAFTWRPIDAQQHLTLSGTGNAGFTRTSSASGEVTGSAYGGGSRASYGRHLGPVDGTLSLGAAASTCACRFGNDGTTTLLDATVSAVYRPVWRGSCQADYTIVRALAPLARGGDRLENHARAFGWVGVGQESTLTASLAYDDGRRELLDITTGTAVSLPEQAISASLGGSTRLGRIYPSAEVRHARNSVVTEGSPFVAGSVRRVRSVTSGLASASWSPRDRLGLQGQLRASYTELSSTESLAALGASLSFTWRLGRLLLTAQYQLARSQLGHDPASFQQSLRASISRPFEL